MKTTLHIYHFDTSKAQDAAAYAELSARLKAQGLKCFCTHGGKGHWFPFAKITKDGPLAVELETKTVWENQWNTAPIPGFSESGYRVFDWAEDYPINFRKCIKRGHYLEQTDEMAEVRRDTMTCGYCGKQEHISVGNVFCPKCLGSEYLKEDQLHLLRMVPACKRNAKRAELTEAERAMLLPRYVEAQLHGTSVRNIEHKKAVRAKVEAKYKGAIRKAETEYEGFSWLLDHDIQTENCIYYAHADKFSFGWRSAINAATLSSLLDVISEFPFTYEIECADGRTLTG